MPLYAWASVIVDGRVVATDYAPDTGWLLPSPGANPGGTDTPDMQPGGTDTPDVQLRGTYLLEDPFPVRLSMTVPDGWTAVKERRFYHDRQRDRDDGSSGLTFVIVDNPTTRPAPAGHGRSTGGPRRRRSRDVSRGSAVDRHLEEHGRHARWLSREIPRVQPRTAGKRTAAWGRMTTGRRSRRVARRRGPPGVDPRRRWRSPGDRRVLDVILRDRQGRAPADGGVDSDRTLNRRPTTVPPV